jgi:hypothetical protein
MLPESGLLDQIKVITVKKSGLDVPYQSFSYAVRLADSIQVQFNSFCMLEPSLVFNLMQSAQVDNNKKLKLDLLVSL